MDRPERDRDRPSRAARRRDLDIHARHKELALRLMAEDASLSKDHAMAKARRLLDAEEDRDTP